MEVKEMAQQYAEDKQKELIHKGLIDAYMAGYKDGYKEGYEKHEEELLTTDEEDTTEYVDLGLPSGTLWAVDYEKNENGDTIYYPYCNAKNLNLPTEEQFNELFQNCRCVRKMDKGYSKYLASMVFIGPNGGAITFKTSGYLEDTKKTDYFEIYSWLKESTDETGNYRKAFNGTETNYVITKRFIGLKLPVRKVRN